jgi:hypothetical protein
MGRLAAPATVLLIWLFGNGNLGAGDWSMEARFICACLAAFAYWFLYLAEKHGHLD